MEYRNHLLLISAARLYSLGVDLEGARETLRQYVESGVSWSSPLMLKAYSNFQNLHRQFSILEKEHLSLRDSSSPQRSCK